MTTQFDIGTNKSQSDFSLLEKSVLGITEQIKIKFGEIDNSWEAINGLLFALETIVKTEETVLGITEKIKIERDEIDRSRETINGLLFALETIVKRI